MWTTLDPIHYSSGEKTIEWFNDRPTTHAVVSSSGEVSFLISFYVLILRFRSKGFAFFSAFTFF